MYKDKYKTFDNEFVPYNAPYSFHGNKLYYMEGKMPTYEMNYGDTTVFPFFIDEQYVDYAIVISIHNFRHEEVYVCTTSVDADNKAYLIIDEELSSELYKGIFHIKVQAINSTTKKVCTLLSADDCLLYVK